MSIAKNYILPIWGVRPGSGGGWPRVCHRKPIFKNLESFRSDWLYLFKWICPTYSISENSGGKLLEQEALIFQFLPQKCLLLFLWYLWNLWFYMSEILYWGKITYPWSNTIGFIRICFTIWYLWSFSQGDLLQDCSEQRSCMACHMSLVNLLSLIIGPPKLKSVPFLEHLQEFYLDLGIPRYCNSPQVSCLGMNSGWG